MDALIDEYGSFIDAPSAPQSPPTCLPQPKRHAPTRKALDAAPPGQCRSGDAELLDGLHPELDAARARFPPALREWLCAAPGIEAVRRAECGHAECVAEAPPEVQRELLQVLDDAWQREDRACASVAERLASVVTRRSPVRRPRPLLASADPRPCASRRRPSPASG